jgi:hypothetical protein
MPGGIARAAADISVGSRGEHGQEHCQGDQQSADDYQDRRQVDHDPCGD